MERSESIAKLSESLSKAQAEIKDTAKTQKGYEHKYADLSSVLRDIRTAFSKHGLSFTQEAKQVKGSIVVNTLLMDKSGEWIKYCTIIPAISMKGCNDAQSAGAGITYARRYAISAIAGIASEEDTDANTNTSDTQETPKPAKPAPPKKQDDSWIKAYLKNMEDLKKQIGDKYYYKVLETFKLKHANEVKTKADATKVYKAIVAEAKMLDPYGKKKKEEEKNA